MPKVTIAPGEIVTLADADDVVVTVTVEEGFVDVIPDDAAQAERVTSVQIGGKHTLGAGPIHLFNSTGVPAVVEVLRASSWVARCDNHDEFRWGPGTRQGARAAAKAHVADHPACEDDVEVRRVV